MLKKKKHTHTHTHIVKKDTQLMVYKPHCSFLFLFFFFLWFFWCTKCKFVLVLRTFFFKHKLHASQILNFSQYLPKCPEIDQNDSKFFQSEIGTPWKKFLESPLLESANRHYWSVDRHMASANQHFPSADWHNFKAWPRNIMIKIKHIHFEFLGIIIRPNSYLIQASLFSKHQTSINRILK